MNKIAVIIVNYNGIKYNKECIDSILKSDYNFVDIIVVDNNSQDDSIKELRKYFRDKIIIYESKENKGFAHATNIGMKYALENNYKYVLWLNNDTIIEKNMISNLIKCSVANNECVVAPKIMYFDYKNTIWSAGGEIKWIKGQTIQYGYKEKDLGQYDLHKNITFASGCCILIPQKVIKTVGLMEEKYFLYYEDTDYCKRIIDNKFTIMYEPSAKMYHKVSATTGGESSKLYIYYMTRSRLYFNNKYNKRKLMSNIYMYLSYFKKYIQWLINKRYDLIRISLNAISDFYHNIEGKADKDL
ncbi:Glycosyl transferase family 2 [human gut metagenome]|uniref:Glycosyl transferase family 2 n=1 Tax=human gut metagenome TaxID=408170 RepID=W1YBL5_9ZZZZ